MRISAWNLRLLGNLGPGMRILMLDQHVFGQCMRILSGMGILATSVDAANF